MNPSLHPAYRALKRKRITDVILTVLASVCSFALIQAVFHVVLKNRETYQPILAVGMILPMGLVCGWLAFRALTRVRDQMIRGVGQGARTGRPVFETLVTTAASVGAFALIEWAVNAAAGFDPGYNPALAWGMAAPMGLVAGGFAASSQARTDRLLTPRRKPAPLGRWMVQEAVLTIVASVAVFALLEFAFYGDARQRTTYQPILALGMILPMAFVLGTITFLFSRRTNRYLSSLTEGLARVADGDFSVELDGNRSGPFRDVFLDFNKMTAELRNLQVLRDDFINSFSHEFKTPIAAIHGFAGLLLELEVSDEDRRRYLEIIASESARLADLAARTLLLSKLESQSLVPDQEVYALDEQLKQCAILLSAGWESKHLSLDVHLEPVLYFGNPELVKQVWLNLLGNAIQFTPEGGRITLTLGQQDSAAVVTVADTGPGIAPEALPRIFDKYFQADPARSGRGLGLGLAIARRIVDLCGGRIEVRSLLGEGTAFLVRLPLR